MPHLHSAGVHAKTCLPVGKQVSGKTGPTPVSSRKQQPIAGSVHGGSECVGSYSGRRPSSLPCAGMPTIRVWGGHPGPPTTLGRGTDEE